MTMSVTITIHSSYNYRNDDGVSETIDQSVTAADVSLEDLGEILKAATVAFIDLLADESDEDYDGERTRRTRRPRTRTPPSTTRRSSSSPSAPTRPARATSPRRTARRPGAWSSRTSTSSPRPRPPSSRQEQCRGDVRHPGTTGQLTAFHEHAAQAFLFCLYRTMPFPSLKIYSPPLGTLLCYTKHNHEQHREQTIAVAPDS